MSCGERGVGGSAGKCEGGRRPVRENRIGDPWLWEGGPRKHGSFLIGFMIYFLFLNNYSGMPFLAGSTAVTGRRVLCQSQVRMKGNR